MSITYGFYNSKNHDRAYDATQFASIFDGIINDGVYSTIGQKFYVSATGNGMIVNVGSGRAWFNHTWTYNDNAEMLVLEQSDLAYDRIDIVALEVNTTDSVRANTIKVITGVPAVTPVAPDLIQSGGVYQYPLAEITVEHGATTISQGVIRQKVNTAACPLVTGPLETISAESLLTQWQAQFNEMLADETAEFNNWFTHLHNELDENQAANLQRQIDDNKGEWHTITISASGWSNGSYSLESVYPSTDYDILDITTNDATTSLQRSTWQKAECGGYYDTNVMTAKGVVPQVDIWLSICVRRK